MATAPATAGEARSLTAEKSDDRVETAQRQAPAQACRQDKIGATPLLPIGHLLSKDRGEANLGHTRTPQYPLPLQEIGRRNHEHKIASALTAGFEQERHIEHRNRFAPRAGQCKKSLFFGSDHRVDNPLEPIERHRVCKNTLAEKRSIDPSRFRPNPRKLGFDELNRCATRREQLVNNPIGVEERNAEPLQRR
jgi:hypothetical protein